MTARLFVGPEYHGQLCRSALLLIPERTALHSCELLCIPVQFPLFSCCRVCLLKKLSFARFEHSIFPMLSLMYFFWRGVVWYELYWLG
jgi:hypothetical protein